VIPFYNDTIVVFGATSVFQGRLVFLQLCPIPSDPALHVQQCECLLADTFLALGYIIAMAQVAPGWY
jgi:hypothetical protein